MNIKYAGNFHLKPAYLFIKVEDIYRTAVYARSVLLLAYPTVVYTRSISLLAYPTVVYASSDTGLTYPTVVYTRSISLLAYQTVVYVHYWHTQLPCA